ncbi:MAG: MG2 domain-containing protein [Verrucomicrobia bacterium]|nr:MG2 domain-containing protein [Verrucomicrobiota bacterium]
MKNWIRSGCAGLLVIAAATPAAGDYPALKKQAEALIAEGSYARAHALYIEAMELSSFSSNEARWVAFRSADTQWRAAAATQSADTTRLDEARTALERMVRDVQRSEEQDRVWVEIQESLGDFWWTSRHQQNWGQAWPYYERALDWWAGQSDLALARQRYLSLVWRCARPPRVEPYYRYGYFGNYMPLPILQNALGIAQSDDDRAHAHYLIATTLQGQGGSWQQQERVADEFEAAIALGRKTDWMDDALYNYAQWMEQRGRFVPMEGGGYRNEPDYVKALELYRQLVKEFGKGETRYYDPARQQIKAITAVQLGVSVANIFLPDSEIQFQLTWRNVRRVDLALYPVDLARDVNLNNLDDQRRQDWLQSIDLAGRETVKVWSFDTQDQGAHQPGNESVRLDEKLKPGAYVLSATAGGEKARDLVLVSDAALVLKTSGKQALVYVCDALSGAPLADSEVTLWASWNENRRWQSLKSGKKTDPDGLAVFDLPGEARHTVLFVGARHGERQAFSAGQSRASRSTWQDWKIYAFTDRPAYRPQETVQWKFTARRYNGSVYSTPASERVEFEITDPRGSKVQSDKVSLNSFGSAWGTLDLADEMPLGEYRIVFWDEDRRQQIGQAALFRLEEYKLPEFKVAVSTPQEKGADGTARPRTFRLGDTVEATITAEYYFGGPVSDADVEVVVYQNPFWIGWPQPREFPWLYSDLDEGAQRWRRSYGAGPIVKRETLKTDANGQAVIRFDTPADEGQDYEYRIEARVTDSSRREIVNTGTVRVTRQRYYVNARAQHNLYQPHDQVRVEFQAQDANRNPVEVEGTVKVTRQYWWEIWIKPDGTEVKGDELKRLQARHPIWPPPPERPDQKGWKLKFRGYEQDELFTRTVKTDTNGMALFSFEPDRVGYYQVSWTSEDRSRNTQYPAQITAETTVWVTDSQSTDIGYRHGGVEIIADKDTFRVGNEAPVMLVANWICRATGWFT